jgi:S1-C subfamily serine protease
MRTMSWCAGPYRWLGGDLGKRAVWTASFLVISLVSMPGNRSRVGAGPPPRNVAAKELAFTDSLQSATLWGGAGGRARAVDSMLVALPTRERSPVPEGQAQKTAWTLPHFDYRALDAQIRLAIQRAKPACVAVVDRRSGNPRSAFSGVIASKEGHILTAAHCIRPGVPYEVTLDDGRKLKAKSLGRSPSLDCALLKIVDDTEFPWAELGKSTELTRNQPCLSISHPGGFNARRGLVTRFGRIVGTNRRGHIHNTCLMEPGDSGGGLFDLEGRVIGIRSYINKSLAENFDIPVDCFRDHWDSLCKTQTFTPPANAARFGIGLRSGRATEDGAEVTSVVKESPAAKAGLRVGDVITSVNETDVTDQFRIGRFLDGLKRKQKGEVKLTVRRDEETHTLVLAKQVPKPYAVVQQDRSHQYDAIAKLDAGFAATEALLDDCTVRVTSKQGKQELSLLGTVLSEDGLIATKSSRVGHSPTVTDSLQRTFAAKIVGRDEENDLVLLRIEGRFQRVVGPATAAERVEGEMLLSPRPGKLGGLLSIVGSRPFRSPERKRVGFLGVTPDMQDSAVILKQVGDGAAKGAGLKPNDTVLKVDDRSITSVDELIATIGSYQPGQEIRVTLKRGDAEQTLPVTLGSRPQRGELHIADEFAGGRSLRHTGFEAVFCHDAHLEPSECGGPLFDAEGNFMGINIARFSRARCYALPPDLLSKCVARIEKQADAASRLKSDAAPPKE